MLLRRHNADTNIHRFYSMHVGCDLFGDWLLCREWGRIGSPGRLKTDRYATQAEADSAFEKLLRKKTRKGYIPIKE